MTKLADFLSMEEVKEIVEYEEHEDEFDLEKEIVIGNEALQDLKLMQSIVAGLEEFTEEETQELTEFLNDKQESVGYEKTEFTPENLDVAIESLTEDMRKLNSYFSIVNRKGVSFESRYEVSLEKFSMSDKFKKNLAGFLSKFNLAKTGPKKLKEKIERIRKLIEKEEGEVSKDFITSGAAKKLSFLKEAQGLTLANKYIDYFDQNVKKRVNFYNAITKDLDNWADYIVTGMTKRDSNFSLDKIIDENAKRQWFPTTKQTAITSTFEKDGRNFFVLAFPKFSTVYSMSTTKEKWTDEYPSVNHQKADKVLKADAIGESKGVVPSSKEEIMKYLDRAEKYADDLIDYFSATKDFISKVSSAYDKVDKKTANVQSDGVPTRNKEMKDIYSMFANAYDFVASEITWVNDDILNMVEKGVDLCYDHFS